MDLVVILFIFNARCNGVFPKDIFHPKLLNNPVASCSLINLNFSLSHTAHFDKSIGVSLFLIATLRLLNSNNKITLQICY